MCAGSRQRVSREHLRDLRVPVLLDFNCSASNDDEVLEVVTGSPSLPWSAPWSSLTPWATSSITRASTKSSKVDLSLDEGVRSLRDVGADRSLRGGRHGVRETAARRGTCERAHHDPERARTLGLRVYLGGFFESPYARQRASSPRQQLRATSRATLAT